MVISVDGVHCRTYEARKNPTAKVYSHKTHGPGVAYELGIAVYENRLVWINGPFHASTHDITIFRGEAERMFPNPNDPSERESLKSKLSDGQRAVADGGYKGEAPGKTVVAREGHSKEVTNHLNRIRARHESFNGRLKGFRILAETFRHGKEKHQTVFEAGCVLIQYDLENGHPLMEV